jgi:hypothetical protein
MIFITALMGVFGVISYFAFGDETASIITLNLGDPTQDSVVYLPPPLPPRAQGSCWSGHVHCEFCVFV